MENLLQTVALSFVFYIPCALLTVDGLRIFYLEKQNKNKQKVDFSISALLGFEMSEFVFSGCFRLLWHFQG